MAQEQVNELFRRYKETGDIRIRNALAEKYLYIADILAKKFVGRGVDYDDLKQVASLALLKGIERFDPDLGMQFSTFITPTITGEIKNYFRDKSRMVKLPRRLSEICASVKRFAADYQAKHGEKASVKDIAFALSLSEEEVVQALEVGGTISLDTVGTTEDDTSLYALLPDNDDRYEKLEEREALLEAAKELTETGKATFVRAEILDCSCFCSQL
ncbi:MAG: sigma-70 family RNA polymerase sigma factor [Clostridia bacterium]|nr:sigma-70 family RNA polymerase sigma factor [Clostridia bacterium]